jgi:hypothetical protein
MIRKTMVMSATAAWTILGVAEGRGTRVRIGHVSDTGVELFLGFITVR